MTHVLITPDLTEWPRAASKPNQSGTTIIQIQGDCRHLGKLTLIEQHNVNVFGSPGSAIEAIYARACSNLYYLGLQLTGNSQLATCVDCLVERSLFNHAGGQPLRIRSNSCKNIVNQCKFIREPPFPTSDIVAIQFSDEENIDNAIKHCTILNYTDGIQTTIREGEGLGLAAGLLIDNCTIGFDQKARYLPGSENCIDLKLGGTAAKPVVISNCHFFGTRQILERNETGGVLAASGGYAITLHRKAQHIKIQDTMIQDCEVGIYCPVMEDWGGAPMRPDCHLQAVQFVDIRKDTMHFPGRSGCAISGPNALTFEDVRFINCDQEYEYAEPLPQFGPHIYI